MRGPARAQLRWTRPSTIATPFAPSMTSAFKDGTALKSLLGQVDAAERALGELDVRKAPPMVSAIAELAKADLALRRIEGRSAKASLDRALLAAKPIPALA